MNLVVLALALIVAGLVLVYTLITGISPLPTMPRAKSAMLNLLPAELDGTIFELGSGWGTLAFPLARRYPRCRVVAYERSPLPWLVSRLCQGVWRLPNLTLIRGDFHGAGLGDAALVVCYLFPGGMRKLEPKLAEELSPGALVVSNFFRLPGWQPIDEHAIGDLHDSRIYLYRAKGSAKHVST
jgi:hypothetical protein